MSIIRGTPIYMNFFDWMWNTSKKKLLRSYDECWRRLTKYFSLLPRRPISNHVLDQMIWVGPLPLAAMAPSNNLRETLDYYDCALGTHSEGHIGKDMMSL